MSSVSVSNCIKFYQTAEDIGAKDLQKYCAEIISNHWVGPIMQCNIHLHKILLFQMKSDPRSYDRNFYNCVKTCSSWEQVNFGFKTDLLPTSVAS